MTWWQALVLGVLQGLTEFLPVSSSGHLALAQMAFNRLGIPFDQPGVAFDAMLHVGTAAAVVWAERRQLGRWLGSADGPRLLLLLIVGTLATATVAFPLRATATAAFENVGAVAVCLIITGAIVLVTRYLVGGRDTEPATSWRQAAVVGLAQGLAVFPGISRSGATIATGLGVGLDREWAARFSFVLSVPAIAGATLAELIAERHAVVGAGGAFWGTAAIGCAAAGVSGYLALRLVIRTVTSRRFHLFACYTIPLGIVVLVALWVVAP
jgi:undecaprenyl-diphosphatase